MVLLLFSTQAFVTSCINNTHTHTRDKGQIFGAGLQLFTSGASAKAAPYGDQRHPHTVKCQGQRRAREPEPKCRGEDKTCFMVAVNLGVARWKCQGSTSTLRVSTHILRRSLGEHAHVTKLGLFCHPSVMFHFLSHPLDSCIQKTWKFGD